MLVRTVLSSLMFLTLICGLATIQSASAQDCHRFQHYPHRPANPYASGYGGYPPSYGYGGPMMGGGYAPSPYAQPAPYYPPAMPSQSIYVGSPYSPPAYPPNYGGHEPRRDDRYEHHHSHHQWHLGHYLLGI